MKHGQTIKIICLFTLLILIVCIPAALSKNQNDYMTNEISLFPVEADAFHASEEEKYSLWERIKIPQKSTTVRIIDRNEFNSMSFNNESAEEMIHYMEEQIRKIQDCKGLPEYEFSDILQGSVTKDIYMDTANPKYMNIFGIWEIYAEYEDFYVIAYMDSKTFALLDVLMEAKEKAEDFVYPPDVTPDGFLEYLSFFNDAEAGDDEKILAYGDYGQRKVHLYLGSVNKTTQQRMDYRFFP